MLNSLTLTNFKRHRDLVVNFTPGINAVRGSNEAGKSTLLHAISYALFGSNSLPMSLEETVTWGEDVKSMRVSLTLTISGETYEFSRGKGGAEVLLNGDVYVTGQKEVTAFATKLLGAADHNEANKLMLASQNGIRGALEEGPKALAQMIESLAGFDTFDIILDAASKKLVLGSPGMLEERLKGAQATYEAAVATLPEKPDQGALNAKVADLEKRKLALEESLPAKKTAANEAKELWMSTSERYMDAKRLEEAVTRADNTYATARTTYLNLKPAASVDIVDNREALRHEIAGAEDWDNQCRAYSTWSELPVGERYEGTAEEFMVREEEVSSTLRTLNQMLNQTNSKIQSAQARRINHDKCDKCGQDVTHLTTVIETNAAVDAELADLKPLLSDLEDKIADIQREQIKLQAINRYNSKMQGLVSRIGRYLVGDISVFPPIYIWNGEPPAEVGPDSRAMRQQLAEVEASIKARDQAKAKLEMAEQQMLTAQAELVKAKEKLAEANNPGPDKVLELDEAAKRAAADVERAVGEMAQIDVEITSLKRDYDQVTALWTACESRVTDAMKNIVETREALEKLGFNNDLVKRLRTIRPEIATLLWNTILSSVSVMFSQMRGEESWITKDADGFKVNGHLVGGLSGSTLDILGLAIRRSLITTFLPECSLLVLDEPAHGCDDARTEAMLGFIAGSGFGQVLLVTHESVSESVADNIIQL